MYASFYGHFRIAKILLERQAFVDLNNKVSSLAVSIHCHDSLQSSRTELPPLWVRVKMGTLM